MSAPSAPLARLDRVTRTFGSLTAVDDVTLDIRPGEIVGLLGPNGAGKSTILTMLQGVRRASSGTVTLFDGDPRDARNRRRLGCTPQQTALPPSLKVGEVIDLVGAHFDDRVPTSDLADEFGLTELLRRQTGALSGGQQRRLAVALAFVGRPKLVLLDEPTTGLDVDGRAVLWEAIRAQHRAGATVVVTSHYLEEIEALAQRVVVVGAGRILADDTLPAVLAQVGVSRIRLHTPQPEAVAALPAVTATSVDADGRLTLTTPDADAAVRELVTAGIPFSGLDVRGASLEEAFLTLTETRQETAA
jgi:ABC-2 type transport system ATP-binding protein